MNELQTLLEAAAEAADVEGAICWQSGDFKTYPDFYAVWEPHLDDAQCAELEAKLRINITWGLDHVVAWESQAYKGERSASEPYANHETLQAARRMAVLRMAAILKKRSLRH